MTSEPLCIAISSLSVKNALYHPHRSAGLSFIIYEMPGTWEALWKCPHSRLLESKYILPISTSRPHPLCRTQAPGMSPLMLFANYFTSVYCRLQRYENRGVVSDTME